MSDTTTTVDPRFPTGKYEPKPYSEQQKQDWLNDIKFLPQLLENAIVNLDEPQLHTPYRDGGWTVQQVVHHVADSHMNAYIRLKLALTEENPTIKPYKEALWAELIDTAIVPVNISTTLLHSVHRRCVAILRNMQESAWQRTYHHPE